MNPESDLKPPEEPELEPENQHRNKIQKLEREQYLETKMAKKPEIATKL